MKKYLIIISLFPVLMSSWIFAKSISEMEKTVFEIKNRIALVQSKIDSLNSLLKNNNNKILDAGDESVLKKTLAFSAEISEEIKIQTNKLKELDDEFEVVRKALYDKICKRLDELKDSSKDDQIVELTRKQIIYAPVVSILEYDPEQLLNYPYSEFEDTLSVNLIKETLLNAITEVDLHLEKISSIHNEYAEISELNRMANEFTEEIEFDSDIRTFSRITTNNNSKSPDLGADITTQDNREEVYSDLLVSNIESYNSIVTQLSIKEIGDLNINLFPKLLKNLSLSDYFTYLNEVKIILSKYKSILIQKRRLFNE